MLTRQKAEPEPADWIDHSSHGTDFGSAVPLAEDHGSPYGLHMVSHALLCLRTRAPADRQRASAAFHTLYGISITPPPPGPPGTAPNGLRAAYGQPTGTGGPTPSHAEG